MMEVPYHIETSPLISKANQWTDVYVIENSVMKELMQIHYANILYLVLLRNALIYFSIIPLTKSSYMGQRSA